MWWYIMLSDIWLFLKSITFIDYIFFFAIVFLIVLVVCLIYFIKVNADIVDEGSQGDDMDDLRKIASNLSNAKPKPVEFTSYEKEQEEKAIISYDELLSNTGQFELNYSDEEVKDDITVRKVDLENLINVKKNESIKSEIHLFTLEKEEAFLLALKELQQKLG